LAFYKYVRGSGWPHSTAETRRKDCRANRLPDDVWAAAIGAGILGLTSLVLFANVYNRMVSVPLQPAEDLTGVPLATLVPALIMGSLVAGVVEESGMRGYMQRPLEERYGPLVAILITGMMFGFLHFTHAEVTIALMPWYMGAAAVYGAIAYYTNSILPGIVLHAGGNMLSAIQLVGNGNAEWQTTAVAQPLIWESGADTSFWLGSVGFIAVTTVAIFAYCNLARTAKSAPVAGPQNR